jgi:translation initiation factor eIF-2B subunit epsilon
VICDIEPRSPVPATHVHPILLPLAGTPLLSYTLELLEQGDVKEITLITCRASQIQHYVNSSRWGERDCPVKVSVVSAPLARSTGDFMREIDRRGLAKDDFVLVRGAVLSSVPLMDMVEAHRRQKDAEKDRMLLTMLLLETPSQQAFDPARYYISPLTVADRFRSNVKEMRVHVFESQRSDNGFYRCLLSEPVSPHSEKQSLSIATDILQKHTNLLLRNDLYDCNIDICTPEVPALFAEDFDTNNLRSSFVDDILTSDLRTKHIYAFIPKTGFSANISSLEDLWRTSVGMTCGLTAPFDPLLNIEPDQSFSKKGTVWKENGTKVHESVQLTNAVLGAGVAVANNANIRNSVIGRNCIIAEAVTIENSVLLASVKVDKGCFIRESIIFDGIELPERSHLAGKSIIPPNTKLSSPFTTPETPKFTIYAADGKPVAQDEDEDEDEEEEEEEEEVEDGDLPTLGPLSLLLNPLMVDTLNLTDTEISDIDSDTDSDDEQVHRRRRSSASSAQSDATSKEEFASEAEDSLSRAFAEHHSVENAAIELKTLRMATNVTFHEVRDAIISALMNGLQRDPSGIKGLFRRWGPLLEEFTKDEDARLDVCLLVQRHFARGGALGKEGIFVTGLTGLYEVDVLEEDNIFQWFEDPRSRGVGEKWGEDMALLRKTSEGFLKWLREAEEESESD